MSDKKDPNKTEYSLEEILAEFGSGRSGEAKKVVDFPEEREVPPSPPEPGPDPVEFPRREREEEEEPMAEIRPPSLFHALAARIHTLRRRAHHFADHMYDQAEPDEDTLRAEKYIPGVDREEVPEKPPRVRRVKPERMEHPDTPPAELVKRFAKGVRSMEIRLPLAVLTAFLCALVSLDFSAVFDWNSGLTAGSMPLPVLRQVIILALFAATGGLCWNVLYQGVLSLCRLRPEAETITVFAFAATLADAVALLLTDSRRGLPCCAVTAFGLVFSHWGQLNRRRGDRISARTAAQTRQPFRVTLDEGKWSGRCAYTKNLADQEGFGRQLQAADGVRRAYWVASPLLLVVCLVCSAFTGVNRGGWTDFLWCASAMFTAASAWSALLVYSSAYRKLADRLFQVGAALAGWPGIARCRPGGILVTDNDLFPTGAVQVLKRRVFGGVSDEKAIAYTATLLREHNCGLTRPFHDLLRTNGAFYRELSGVRNHEGGITGIIRNHSVYVGTADFMHLLNVALPQGDNMKHVLFCAIDDQLAGIFTLKYDMSPTVRPCLAALLREGVSPVLCTRDPNLTPDFLRQRFKLPVDRMEYPAADRRKELSDPLQEHDETPVALLIREGLTPFCDAVVGSIRLRKAVRWGTLLTLAGSIIGAAITFYLTYVGAVDSLTTANFLLFMALWLLPERLLSGWVGQF